MENSPSYFDPRTLAKLSGLELRARHVVEGYVSGLHRSPYHGFSIEFAQHREYVPGDDLRYVDWKVYGRSDKIYLKQYEQETNLVAYLLLDASESMLYQGERAALSKLEYAKTAAASLAYLVIRHQDSAGLATFDSEVRALARPASTPSHFKELVHLLEQTQPQGKTTAGAILHHLAERFTKRGVVLVFSDLFDDVAALSAGLKHLRHRRHDVVLFHVLDRDELEFPFRQPSLFLGLEGLPNVSVDARALRKAYLEQFNKFQEDVRRACLEVGGDYVLMPTDQPLDVVLSQYLASRMARAYR